MDTPGPRTLPRAPMDLAQRGGVIYQSDEDHEYHYQAGEAARADADAQENDRLFGEEINSMKLFDPIELVIEDLQNDLPTAGVMEGIRMSERIRHLKSLQKRVEARQLGMEMHHAYKHVQQLEDDHCVGFAYGCYATKAQQE